MDEQAKLVCPECQATHRVKRLVSGKIYRCKRCGTALPLSEGGRAGHSEKRAADVASSGLLAAASGTPSQAAAGQTSAGVPAASGPAADIHLRRLSALSDALAENIDRLRETGIGSLAAELSETAGKMAVLSTSIDGSLSEHGERMARQMADFESAKARYESDLKKTVTEAIRDSEEEGAKNGDRVAERILSAMDGKFCEQRKDLSGVYSESAPVAEVKKMVEELAARVRSVAERIENPPAPDFGRVLPDQIVEVIGRTVEERVVAPVASAIARQAPEILASVQDQKLVDVVSRSVREAQRPLIREIMHGGRGVPVWLFASILLPLLLILGYLFLPGELGFDDDSHRLAELERGMTAIERDIAALAQNGVRLGEEEGIRLREVEIAVKSMYENAIAQAQNTARLETEIKNLRDSLADRDQKLTQYDAAVQQLTNRARAYELHLTRLGIAPETLYKGESE